MKKYVYVFCLVLSLMFLPINNIADASSNYSEDFITSDYKDAASTTANWDTTNNNVSIGQNLTDRINSFWGTDDIYAMTLDADNQILYLGGGEVSTSVKFAKYDIQNDIATDLSANVSVLFDRVDQNPIVAIAISPTDNNLYLSAGNPSGWPDGPHFIKYDPSSDIATDLSAAIPFWGNSVINALFVNGDDVYLLGDNAMDSSVRFARYHIARGDSEDLSGYINTVRGWEEITLFSFAYDNDHTLYLGAHGTFGAYDLSRDVLVDLTGILQSSNWNDVDPLWGLTFDEENNNIIVSGGARYAGMRMSQSYAIYSIDSGTITHSFTSGENLPLIGSVIDPASGEIYVTGGSSGGTPSSLFAQISGNDDNAPVNIHDAIGAFWPSTSSIESSVYNSGTIPGIYLAGFSGYFGFYPIPAEVQSLNVNPTNSIVHRATLSAETTLGSGTATFSLSNDGGLTWTEVTPGEEIFFTGEGKDLRWKAVLTNDAQIDSLSIDYDYLHRATGGKVEDASQEPETTPAVNPPSTTTSTGNVNCVLTQRLAQGSKGDEVKCLQVGLNTKLISNLVVDGMFGKLTKAAVIKFQLANNLVGDGIVGPITRGVFNKNN